MTAAVRGSRALYGCELFTLGEFHLDPGEPRWRETNCIGAGHHVVFPGTAVRIAHDGRAPIVADPNTVVLYRPFQEYRRALVSRRGDHCTFVIVEEPLLAELLGPDDDPFASEAGRPSPAGSYLVQRVTAARARAAEVDRLEIEEAIVRVLEAVLAARRRFPPPRALVEDTKAVLGARYAENMTLAEIAAEVFVSPYHLARVFRAHSASSIHSYRNQLRLRAAIGLLAESQRSIAAVAAEVGFSSHAHFTEAFGRAFGAAPSSLRRRGADLSEISTFLEA